MNNNNNDNIFHTHDTNESNWKKNHTEHWAYWIISIRYFVVVVTAYSWETDSEIWNSSSIDSGNNAQRQISIFKYISVAKVKGTCAAAMWVSQHENRIKYYI